MSFVSVAFWLDADGRPQCERFESSSHPDPLNAALAAANARRAEGLPIVAVATHDTDQVGQMGVTAVEGGKLPDGRAYTWKMRRP